MFGIVSPPLCYIQTYLHMYVGVHEIKIHALAQTNTRARAFYSRALNHISHTLSGPDSQKVSDVQTSNLYGNFIINYRIKLALQVLKQFFLMLDFLLLSLCVSLSLFLPTSFSLHNMFSTNKNVILR